MKQITLLIAAVISFVIGYGGFNLYLFEKSHFLKNDIEATSWYMLYTSISYALISIALHYAIRDKGKEISALTSTLVCFNVNQALDEMFFNPSEFQLNELGLLIVWAILITRSYYAKHRAVV